MDITIAAKQLNQALTIHNPLKFNSSWIYQHTPQVYRFIRRSLRTAGNELDWDTLTRHLDRLFQKRWVHRRVKRTIQDSDAVASLLTQYQDKLYVFVSILDVVDIEVRDTLSIALVRMAQRGNVVAQQELLERLQDTIQDWIERDPRIMRWHGYTDRIQQQIVGCIRRYRYSGSFMRYLYCTLEYAGRGLYPLVAYSLDAELPSGKKRLVENVVQDAETGVLRVW